MKSWQRNPEYILDILKVMYCWSFSLRLSVSYSEWHAFSSKKYAIPWDFPMVQLLRIQLPLQGAQVQFLAPEDPRCCGAAKPLLHSCWACELQETPLQWEAPAPKQAQAHHTTESPHAATTQHSPPKKFFLNSLKKWKSVWRVCHIWWTIVAFQ